MNENVWGYKDHDHGVFTEKTTYAQDFFKVSYRDTIIPTTAPEQEDVEMLVNDLDSGNCPVCESWEDGGG